MRPSYIILLLVLTGCSLNKARISESAHSLPASTPAANLVTGTMTVPAFIRDNGVITHLEDVAPVDLGLIRISENVVEGLFILYHLIADREYVLCLEGTVHKYYLEIDNFRLARFFNLSNLQVNYRSCSDTPRFIGIAHSHPDINSIWEQCQQSNVDVNSFLSESRAMIEIIACGPRTFFWALKDREKATRLKKFGPS